MPNGRAAEPHGRDLRTLDLRGLHAELLAAHGPQGRWWPGAGTFAMPVSAVLVHQVTWGQVETALGRLYEAGALRPEALAAMDAEAVRTLIRPAGFMRAKGAGLQALARWTLENDDAAVRYMGAGRLRTSLLALPTIGPETADAIALYRYGYPSFIADAYARRLLKRLGFNVPKDYERTRKAVDPAWQAAAFDAADAAELHGLIVEDGKRRSGR